MSGVSTRFLIAADALKWIYLISLRCLSTCEWKDIAA